MPISIAGDKPMINTHAVQRRDHVSEKFELYYPLTPGRAMLWSEAYPGQHGARIRLGEAEIHHYNRMIASASHQMIFAASPAALDPARPA